MTKILRLDSKKRITLGDLAAKDATSYRIRVQANGDIVLTPMVEMPLALVQSSMSLMLMKSTEKK